jgi:virulence factor Mce-like protein
VIKQAPGPGRILAMLVFALSCFGILMFLWLTFGGSVPLRPEGYRFSAAVPEAATLPVEADVRLAGVNVGKVKKKELEPRAQRTLVEIELEPEFAPVQRDARLVLRQKTLLGEAYLELAPGRPDAEKLPDGGRLADAQVEQTVQLDEIFSSFDEPTRRFFRLWVRQVGHAVRGRRGRDLSQALGNLAGVTVSGERVFSALDGRRAELERLVRDGGTVLGAINERRGALRGLVENGERAFRATASRDDALAEAVSVLPTFLDESRATLARLERFSGSARPLVRELRPAADDLAPTLDDLAALSPDLEVTFRDLRPLIAAGRRGLPALGRTARGARPLVGQLDPFLDELNPVLASLSYYRLRVAGFLSNGGVGLNNRFQGERALPNTVVFDNTSFESFDERPERDRGNAYLQPNVFNRVLALGTYEASDCSRAVGPRNRYGDVPQDDALDVAVPALKPFSRRPACVQAGPGLRDGRFFDLTERGRAPLKDPPRGTEGSLPTAGRP